MDQCDRKNRRLSGRFSIPVLANIHSVPFDLCVSLSLGKHTNTHAHLHMHARGHTRNVRITRAYFRESHDPHSTRRPFFQLARSNEISLRNPISLLLSYNIYIFFFFNTLFYFSSLTFIVESRTIPRSYRVDRSRYSIPEESPEGATREEKENKGRRNIADQPGYAFRHCD